MWIVLTFDPHTLDIRTLQTFFHVVDVLINPLGTVDGYSRSLRDATGLVDMYSRIPTSTQVMCTAA